MKPVFATRYTTSGRGTYLGKPFAVRWIEVDCSYEVDGDFTNDEKAEVAVAFEITNVMKEVRKYCVVQVRINAIGEVTACFLAYRDNWQVGLHWTTDFKNSEIIWCDTIEEANIRKGNNENQIVSGHFFMVEDKVNLQNA